MYSSQSPSSPIRERIFSAPNGQTLCEIFTDNGEDIVYDCSTWPENGAGRIEELNVRLDLKSDFIYGLYKFQNIPLKATLRDLKNEIIGDKSDSSLYFMHEGIVLLPAFSLNFYQITSGDLIYVINGQQYTAIKNDSKKLKKVKG